MKMLFHCLFVFQLSFGMTQENISCDCISYNEMNLSRKHVSHHTVPAEELTQVPPLSETWVNYLSDYSLEKDSLGRVSKLIRTNNPGKNTQETSYFYDSDNRLIREKVIFNKAVSENHSAYREEQIDFTYDENGRRIRKVTKVIYGATEEVILEECTYTY